MKRQLMKGFAVMAAVMFLSITVMEATAQARAGGSRSSGSRGSRSYSRQAPTAQPTPYRQQMAPGAQQAGGGFMRSMAGGVMGGMLGSMLFGGSAGAGGTAAQTGGQAGGQTGGGIGFVEIALLAGGVYLIYRFMNRKKDDSSDPYGRG